MLVAALLVAGCATSASQSPPATPSPIATPSPTAPAPSGSATSAVVVDPALLALLPAAVAGLPIAESPDAESASLDDPGLAKLATAFAAGVAVDANAGSFVYAVVIRLKPGALTADAFRDYRDTFDLGACSQSNGVTGNAEAQIGGRTVYIGSCGGGLRTYHVWLEARGIVVSASAVGGDQPGVALMDSLRP